MKRKQNKSKVIILYLAMICCALTVLSLTIGFSVYQAELTVDSSVVAIRVDKNVRITSFQVTSVQQAETSYTEYSVNKLYTNVNMPEATSTITYKVGIKNYGNVEMGISSITINDAYKDILEVESIQIGDKIRDVNGNCEEEINGCKLNLNGEFYITIKYKDGMYNSNNTTFDNLILDVQFNEAFEVTLTDFDFTLTEKQKVALEGEKYTLEIGNIAANEKLVVTMNNQEVVDYTYQDNILTINEVTGDINISKTSVAGTYHNVTYQNITNNNYPTVVLDNDNLTIEFTDPIPSSIAVLNNDNYTYQNGILTINNIQSDITIIAIDEIEYPVIPGEDETTVTIPAANITTSNPVTVRDLLAMTFEGQNISKKVINQIDVEFTYTTTTGAAQSINCILNDGTNSYTQVVNFDTKVTNAKLTVSFTNLSIGENQTFNITLTENSLKNANINVSGKNITVHFTDI